MEKKIDNIEDKEYIPLNKREISPESKRIKKVHLPKEEKKEEEVNTNENKDIPISCFYYINKNKLKLDDLKNGRRIFHNKTELSQYNSNDPDFNKHFIEFRQLFFENLLLNEDFTENAKQPLTIQSAVFSTFVYDEEFIEPMINAFKLKSIIIRHREDNHKYTRMEEYGNYIKFVYPKIEYTLRWGKFHSKLIVLKFPNFLRVIVPSANLTNGDWYYWGQVIWFQDFPKKDKTDKNDKEDEFCIYLKRFFTTFMPHTYEGKRFWTDLNINFDEYYYSDVCVDLIASANGRFKDEDKNMFGVGRLTSLYESKFKKNKYMIVQCSSIGNTKKEKFFTDVYKGFNLDNNPKIDIIYPTEEYIDSFPLGRELTSCLFLGKEAYEKHKDKFKIIELKKDYEDRKTVFHSKIFITGEIAKIEGREVFRINEDSIMYFGSHNFSAAAFGSFEKGDTQVSMSNYELGVVFNPRKLTYEEKEEIFNSMIINVNSRYYDSKKDYPLINEFN